MVDPNPARGMPLALQRYWLVGKGALKIRWNTHGDFMRCVRALTKYFPKDPKGLCNILHTKATGGPPGHGSLEHSAEGLTAATNLLAMQPKLGDSLWAGPLAPINRPTGEPRRQRVFEPGALTHRDLPLPLAYRKVANDGHAGAVTVGRVLGMHQGPDHNGQEWMYGWGDWLDPSVVPEVTEAKYMVDQGVVGPSVDPGGKVVASLNPDTGAEHMSQYTIGGVTLVAIPAFASMRLQNLTQEGDFPGEDPDMEMPDGSEEPDMPMMAADQEDCGCGADGEFVVNAGGWRGLPLAPRDAVFDNDNAVKRITAWAQVAPQGTDVAKLKRAFLWQDARQPDTDPLSYRLPVGDIINNQLTLVFHAVYAAAALISGAHGGLPDVPDPDKAALRNVISDIYKEMAKSFNDTSIVAPWDRPGSVGGGFAMTNPKEPYGDVKYADPGYQPDHKKRYPLDSIEHCKAAWAYINQADNASQYNPKQLALVKGRIVAALKKYGVAVSDQSQQMSIDESPYPIDPPLAWFSNPRLTGKTPVTVTPEGQVFGHLAAWDECHRDVTNRSCVLAPKSRQQYAPFHLGQVFTAEGEMIRVGKIVMDTRHADISLGYASAALHYDDTGDEVAVVRAGEDQYGIWVAGAVVPEATPKKVAKLRRSPLSGDWRRVDGNLELTAALAVNVPAFPVYAMDGEDQLALVAAGSVVPEFDADEPSPVENFDLGALVAAIRAEMSNEDAQEDRAWKLREIIDEDDTEEQERRMNRLADIYAADTTGAPLPAVQVPTPAPVAPPVPGAAPVDPNAAPDIYGDQAQLQRQMDASTVYSIVNESDNPPAPPPTDAAAPAAAPAPAAPVPAPAAPVPAPVQ